ncbi:MAG: molybdate ABC transporter substrate-binding protein [Acidimicrobiales bacterium]
MPRSLSAGLLALAVVLGACSGDAQTTAAVSGSSSGGTSAPMATGSLTVFAAASLTESFNEEKPVLEGANPGLTVTYSFAGSGTLVTQVTQGAPADVIATADTASMQRLVDASLVEVPTTFAQNQLEMLVAPGNPKGIKGLADLARTDILYVAEDETVPAGKYAAQALLAAGISPRPVSKEADVKAAVAKVTSGEADVTVVYRTDVTAAGSKGQGVPIPDAQNVVATYPVAIVKATTNRTAAVTFVDAIVSGSGQDALKNHGFLPPS